MGAHQYDGGKEGEEEPGFLQFTNGVDNNNNNTISDDRYFSSAEYVRLKFFMEIFFLNLFFSFGDAYSLLYCLN